MLTLNITITAEQLFNLFVTATEGGINYWAGNFTLTDKDKESLPMTPQSFEDGNWEFYLDEFDEDGEVYAHHVITPTMMASNLPHVPVWALADWLFKDNLDAEGADVIFQCILFKQVQYG